MQRLVITTFSIYLQTRKVFFFFVVVLTRQQQQQQQQLYFNIKEKKAFVARSSKT